MGSSETLRGTFFFSSFLCCIFNFFFAFSNCNKKVNGILYNQYKSNNNQYKYKSNNKTKKTSAYDFSNYIKIKPIQKKPNALEPDEIAFLEWFIGFSEGDGSFMIKDNRCIFVINQADAYVLNKIRTNLGFGKVRSYNQNGCVFARYTVQGEELVKKLINIFNGNIHLQKVFYKFEIWVKHYNTYAKQPVIIKPRLNPQNITLESAWISGFYDAEGGLHASIGEQITKNGTKVIRLKLNAYVDQQHEEDVLKRLQFLFGITSLTIRNAEKKYFRLEASTKKTLKNILNYFNIYPLRGKKHVVYAIWKKLVLRFIYNTHLGCIDTFYTSVKKIKEQNNKFKIEKNAFCFITLKDETLL